MNYTAFTATGRTVGEFDAATAEAALKLARHLHGRTVSVTVPVGRESALVSAALRALNVLADINGTWLTPDAKDDATRDMRRRSLEAQDGLFKATDAYTRLADFCR